MDAGTKPRVLFVYYTFTKQAQRVTEDMESVFRDRGWDTERAQIEFTDSRYVTAIDETRGTPHECPALDVVVVEGSYDARLAELLRSGSLRRITVGE